MNRAHGSGLLRAVLCLAAFILGIQANARDTDAGLCEFILHSVKEEPIYKGLFSSEYASEEVLRYLFEIDRKIPVLENMAGQGRISPELKAQLAVAHWFEIQVLPIYRAWQSNVLLRADRSLEDELLHLAETERSELLVQLEHSLPSAFAPLLKIAGLNVPTVILEIAPSPGLHFGIESANQLAEMYRRYAQKKDWSFEILDSHIFRISGRDALGLLQGERGIHRFIIQGDATGSAANRNRTHTRYVEVKVYAEPTHQDPNFSEKDVLITTMRASGNGGQNVNKVETAVRAVHQPTNLEVRISIEREQGLNRQIALQYLKAKVLKHYSDLARENLQRIRRSAGLGLGEGRYTRTYDERYENGQTSLLLTANLDPVLNPARMEALAQRLSELRQQLRDLR